MTLAWTSALLLALTIDASCNEPIYTIQPMIPDTLGTADSSLLGKWQDSSTKEDLWSVNLVIDSGRPSYEMILKGEGKKSAVRGRTMVIAGEHVLEVCAEDGEYRNAKGQYLLLVLPLCAGMLYRREGDTLRTWFAPDSAWESWLVTHGQRWIRDPGYISDAPPDTLRAAFGDLIRDTALKWELYDSFRRKKK